MLRLTEIKYPIIRKDAVVIMKNNGYFRKERIKQLKYIKENMTEYNPIGNFKVNIDPFFNRR